MQRDPIASDLLSEFMKYLAAGNDTENDRIPPLSDLSQELGISIASLREQLEVARALGLVEVRPRTGIRRLPYNFREAALKSVGYAVNVDPANFAAFSDFRNHIEATYWYQAVGLLTSEDHAHLKDLIRRAQEKIHGNPPQIPHNEHRDLHLTIYCRLNNPFVTGVLEAYWELYKLVGLDVYTDLAYQQRVWNYHQRMVDAICQGNTNIGYEALMEHMDLIFQRNNQYSYQKFE